MVHSRVSPTTRNLVYRVAEAQGKPVSSIISSILDKTTKQLGAQNSWAFSAGSLAMLNMPDFCPRCAAIEFKCKNLPFRTPFPSIFDDIDRYTKAVLRAIIRNGKLPAWLADIGEINSYVNPSRLHWSCFKAEDPLHKFTIRGVPDDIYETPRGYHIVDYKTWHYSEDNPLLPRYKAQLNLYLYIAEKLSITPIAGLWLVCFEPTRSPADPETVVSDEGMLMGFVPHVVRVEIDHILPFNLITKAAALILAPELPGGRAGCRNCSNVDNLVRMLHTAPNLFGFLTREFISSQWRDAHLKEMLEQSLRNFGWVNWADNHHRFSDNTGHVEYRDITWGPELTSYNSYTDRNGDFVLEATYEAEVEVEMERDLEGSEWEEYVDRNWDSKLEEKFRERLYEESHDSSLTTLADTHLRNWAKGRSGTVCKCYCIEVSPVVRGKIYPDNRLGPPEIVELDAGG